MKNNHSIYVILCKENKYYIGRTSKNVNDRFTEHMTGKNSSWFTKKYKPLEIVEIIENAYPTDETSLTIKYMNDFGIDNVRGGVFNTFYLSDLQIAYIKDEINHSENRCSKCSQKGHFIKDCKNISVFICNYCGHDSGSFLEKACHEKHCLNDIDSYDNYNYLLTMTNKFHNDILIKMDENVQYICSQINNKENETQCCIII